MGSYPEPSDNGIGHLVAINADRQPDKPAILDGEASISYGELHWRAQGLCLELIRAGLRYEDPVGILTRHGAEHIVAQLAVVYAGGSCLPLDPYHSDIEIKQRLEFAKVGFLIVDASHRPRSFVVDHAFLADIAAPCPRHASQAEAPDGVRIPRKVHPDFRSHVLFTSGTTGIPKAAQVPGRGILRVALDHLWRRSTTQGRFGHINATVFDVSLIDIWVALIHGATTIVMDKQEILSPTLFARALRQKQITHMYITASLFSVVASASPTAFSGLKTLIVGGESPSIEACKLVLQAGAPQSLVNGYGPTECSIFAFTHHITMSDIDRGYLPIGKPIYQIDAYILDSALEHVSGDGSGELCLGGRGLFRGYLFDQNKTLQSLVTVSDPRARGKTVLVYRTGDIVKTDFAGNVVWVGRKDNEIKFKGYRINLDVLESELLKTGLIDAAVAMKVQCPGSDTAILVACVVYKAGTGSCDALLREAKARLPMYMVPDFMAFDELPLNRNYKIDRAEVSREVAEILRNRQNQNMNVDAADFQGLSPTEKRLKQLWARILVTVPTEVIHAGSDFFALGATSLNVAVLLARIQETFGVPLPARVVFECPRLKDVATFIENRRPNDFAEHAEQVKTEMRNDVVLARTIEIPKGIVPAWQSPNEGNVFITGTTGFVGAFLLHELLQVSGTRTIRCLIRAESRVAAFERLFANLEKYHLSVSDCLRSKLEVVPGDFSKPRLGLTETAFRDLANWTSVIYHLGAQVNYNQPYSTHRPANVIGTLNMLGLAATGKPKPFHYISSISAFGPTGLVKSPEDRLEEDEPLAPYLETTLPYETGYGQSQWVAEEIVAGLMHQGFPAAVYRMGFVLCNSANGVGNPDDFVGRVLTDCVKLGVYPFLPAQRKELLSVDSVATALKTISLSNRNLGRVYHITPDVASSIDMEDLFRLAARLCKVQMKGLPYPDWVAELKRADGMGASLRLRPLFPILEERVYDKMTRWEACQGMARFKSENTANALKEAGEEFNTSSFAINEKFLERYLVELGLVNQETD